MSDFNISVVCTDVHCQHLFWWSGWILWSIIMAGGVYFLYLLWKSLFVCPSWKDVFDSGYINCCQNLPSCAYNETGLLAAGISKHQHRPAVGAFIGASLLLEAGPVSVGHKILKNKKIMFFKHSTLWLKCKPSKGMSKIIIIKKKDFHFLFSYEKKKKTENYKWKKAGICFKLWCGHLQDKSAMCRAAHVPNKQIINLFSPSFYNCLWQENWMLKRNTEQRASLFVMNSWSWWKTLPLFNHSMWTNI